MADNDVVNMKRLLINSKNLSETAFFITEEDATRFEKGRFVLSTFELMYNILIIAILALYDCDMHQLGCTVVYINPFWECQGSSYPISIGVLLIHRRNLLHTYIPINTEDRKYSNQFHTNVHAHSSIVLHCYDVIDLLGQKSCPSFEQWFRSVPK